MSVLNIQTVNSSAKPQSIKPTSRQTRQSRTVQGGSPGTARLDLLVEGALSQLPGPIQLQPYTGSHTHPGLERGAGLGVGQTSGGLLTTTPPTAPPTFNPLLNPYSGKWQRKDRYYVKPNNGYTIVKVTQPLRKNSYSYDVNSAKNDVDTQHIFSHHKNDFLWKDLVTIDDFFKHPPRKPQNLNIKKKDKNQVLWGDLVTIDDYFKHPNKDKIIPKNRRKKKFGLAYQHKAPRVRRRPQQQRTPARRRRPAGSLPELLLGTAAFVSPIDSVKK